MLRAPREYRGNSSHFVRTPNRKRMLLGNKPAHHVKSSPPPQSFSRKETSPGESRRGWEIALAGDLTDKQMDLIDRLIEVPARSRGTVYFDSCGGSAYVGLSLAALIRLRGLDVTGVVLGECSSAALLPFAACRRRYVTPISYLFFHP